MTQGKKTLLQWVEISRAALASNIREFRKSPGGRGKLLAVVKANAYGHGLCEVGRIAVENGMDWLGVNSLEEGRSLRESGIKAPVLILGYVPLDRLDEAVELDLRLNVFNRETVAKLAAAAEKLGRKAFVHVKVETGTNRLGVAPERLLEFARLIKSHDPLVLEGLVSHYANIEDTTKDDYPKMQREIFRRAVAELAANGIKVPLRHMSCTAATILFHEPGLNMSRVGIGLYGLWPSPETLVSCLLRKKKPLTLKPVLSWKTRVAHLKQVPASACVGYGCTYKTTRPTLLAVIPVGYADGYDRGLSNTAYVLVRGGRAAVRGRVAMNFMMADVTDIPGVRLEDEVTLIGTDGKEQITADDLAGWTGTINYEILSRINPALPRIVV